MQELALASDNQLRTIAKIKANQDFVNSPNRQSEHHFATMLPVMDSFLTGAATKGSLKKKVLAGGSQLKDWGIFLAVTSLYNKAIDKIVEKSDTMQNFKDNSPFAFGILNTVVGVAAGMSGVRYINKGYQKFVAPYIPKSVKTVAKNIVGSTDSSSVGQAVNNGMKSFSKNYPKLTKGLNTVAKWAMPVLCLAYMTSLAIDMVKAKSNENKTYKQLEKARLAAAQEMAIANN